MKVEGDFTYEKWIDGIRKCQTFTTSGPLLFLEVNGADIGDTLEVERGTKLRITAKALSQLLGEDHDIFMLGKLVSTPTMTFGSPEETTAFLKRCSKRQRALRKEARAEGERLFAEQSRPFAERIEGHWALAASAAAGTDADTRTGNVVAFGDMRTPRAG